MITVLSVIIDLIFLVWGLEWGQQPLLASIPTVTKKVVLCLHMVFLKVLTEISFKIRASCTESGHFDIRLIIL